MGEANVVEQNALDKAHVLLDACTYSCTSKRTTVLASMQHAPSLDSVCCLAPVVDVTRTTAAALPQRLALTTTPGCVVPC